MWWWGEGRSSASSKSSAFASGLFARSPLLLVARSALFRSALVFAKILADYCECFSALPAFAADLLSRVVELLKAFNRYSLIPLRRSVTLCEDVTACSRCCQLILGAGALQLVGLKTISVRNLGTTICHPSSHGVCLHSLSF